MKWIVSGALLAVVLSGCGGHPSSTSDSQAAKSPPVSLRATCPKVEAALPKGLIPPAAKWQHFSDVLVSLSAAGDTETKNALIIMKRASDKLASDPANGSPYAAAFEQMTAAANDLAKRCKAVGSSAMQ